MFVFRSAFLVCCAVLGGCWQSTTVLFHETSPPLQPGRWGEVTPVAAERGRWANVAACPAGAICSYGTSGVTLDPSNPSVVYLCIDNLGLWRSETSGSTWTRLGDGVPDMVDDAFTSYLDSPSWVAVDPANPRHLYAVQSTHGLTHGFWVSQDRGQTWTTPEGFASATFRGMPIEGNVVSLSVDPSRFDHLLIGLHGVGGIGESSDGGASWRFVAPDVAWGGETRSAHILHEPALGVGVASTWLVIDDHEGFWRTTDAGASWTQVSPQPGMQGGSEVRYASDGALYAGATQYPMRSLDNGATWSLIEGGLFYGAYHTIGSDGAQLYAHPDTPNDVPYFTSSVDDGTAWTTADTFLPVPGTPFAMTFDATHRVLFSSNGQGGLWALLVPPLGS